MVGDIIWVPLLFTNLSGRQSRPAILVAYVDMDDWLVCEVVERQRGRPGDIEITAGDLATGELDRNSWARPGRIHALNESLFEETVGRLTDAKLAEVLAAVRGLF